jgi:hypothetical protein
MAARSDTSRLPCSALPGTTDGYVVGFAGLQFPRDLGEVIDGAGKFIMNEIIEDPALYKVAREPGRQALEGLAEAAADRVYGAHGFGHRNQFALALSDSEAQFMGAETAHFVCRRRCCTTLGCLPQPTAVSLHSVLQLILTAGNAHEHAFSIELGDTCGRDADQARESIL